MSFADIDTPGHNFDLEAFLAGIDSSATDPSVAGPSVADGTVNPCSLELSQPCPTLPTYEHYRPDAPRLTVSEFRSNSVLVETPSEETIAVAANCVQNSKESCSNGLSPPPKRSYNFIAYSGPPTSGRDEVADEVYTDTHSTKATNASMATTPPTADLIAEGESTIDSFVLPATAELFMKGLDLGTLLRKMQLHYHWVEVVPPKSLVKSVVKQLLRHERSDPMETLPHAFLASICQQYRYAIMKRIALTDGTEALLAQLESLGTSLSSPKNLYPSWDPNYPDTLSVEDVLEPYFNKQPAFFVLFRKVKVWEPQHESWSGWALESTTVGGAKPS